jgi:proteasome lid subunit RPN8/RPN11
MKLSQQLLHQIHRHLESGYPNEACGFMLGKDGVITEIVPADNQRTDSARNRYLIDHLLYVKVQNEADKRGMDLMGIYHSHPDVAARPSQFDLEQAWPDFSYLIVSVRKGSWLRRFIACIGFASKGNAVESNSWRLRDDRSAFDQEAVEFSG